MTEPLNIAEAKAKLSALVDRAASGEEIVLAKNGKPLARIVPLAKPAPRQPGVARHWSVPKEFDDWRAFEPDEEDAEAWNGERTDEWGISKRAKPRQ
ncbi:MAG: type II toxin-antitoxin system prevent-host-death family antitoxin [Pseudomonadota bacterium]